MIMDLALVAVLGLVGGLFLLIWFLVARHDKKSETIDFGLTIQKS